MVDEKWWGELKKNSNPLPSGSFADESFPSIVTMRCGRFLT
jgi:hypothetical protein